MATNSWIAHIDVEAVVDEISQNIRDTILEHGGNPWSLDGLRAAGWESGDDAIEAQYSEAWDIWRRFNYGGSLDEFNRDWLVARRLLLARWGT